MYQISVDRARGRVDLYFIGSFTDIEPAVLSRDLRAGIGEAKRGGTSFDLLVDYSRAPVIPRDRTVSAREEIEWSVANGLRRSANVVGSAIARMQLQRLSVDDRFRNFASRAEALAWLRSID